MELSDLTIFRTVVREGGITRAADKLGRVQSNVTKRIQQLEDRLETALFDRRGRRLVLTSSGKTLLDYADRLLALAAEAEEALHGARLQGVLRLGAMESTAAVRLPAPLASFSAAYPDVVLEMRTGNPTQMARALLAGEIDAAFVAEPVATARFDSLVAFVEEAVIVTAQDHPFFENDEDVPRTVLVFENGCPHRKRLEDWYAARQQMPERTVELGSYHAMLGCVLAGMGAALVPRSVISTFPEKQRLRITTLPPQQGRIQTLMIWPKGAVSPKVKALAQVVCGDGQAPA